MTNTEIQQVQPSNNAIAPTQEATVLYHIVDAIDVTLQGQNFNKSQIAEYKVQAERYIKGSDALWDICVKGAKVGASPEDKLQYKTLLTQIFSLAVRGYRLDGVDACIYLYGKNITTVEKIGGIRKEFKKSGQRITAYPIFKNSDLKVELNEEKVEVYHFNLPAQPKDTTFLTPENMGDLIGVLLFFHTDTFITKRMLVDEYFLPISELTKTFKPITANMKEQWKKDKSAWYTNFYDMAVKTAVKRYKKKQGIVETQYHETDDGEIIVSPELNKTLNKTLAIGEESHTIGDPFAHLRPEESKTEEIPDTAESEHEHDENDGYEEENSDDIEPDLFEGI